MNNILKSATHYTWLIAALIRKMVSQDKGNHKTGRPEMRLVHTSRDGNTGKQIMVVVVEDVPHIVTVQKAEIKSIRVDHDEIPNHVGAWN